VLVASGPPAAGALPGDEQQTALVCRDTVAGELRDLTRAVLRAGPDGTAADPQLLAASPPHALHAALIDLPAAADPGLPLSQALAVAGGPLTQAWQDAARDVAAVERYHDVAAELTGPNAWSLARDVAELPCPAASALSSRPCSVRALDLHSQRKRPGSAVDRLVEVVGDADQHRCHQEQGDRDDPKRGVAARLPGAKVASRTRPRPRTAVLPAGRSSFATASRPT